MSVGTQRWQVSEEEAGIRLDRYVAARADQPRNQVQQWIESGHVTLDGEAAKASTSVAVGSQIDCTPPSPPAETLIAEDGELILVFEDQDLLVLDKPAGLAVHPGAGRPTGTLAHRILGRYPEISGIGGAGRPGIVHRIDLDTTGLLVIARSELAYRKLTSAFAERTIDKTYQAIVYGVPRDEEGTVELAIGRHRGERRKMAVNPQGRPAVTHYRCRRSAAGISRLEVEILTGRTHQIRVHMKAIGHPLVGDPIYGEARWKGLPRERRSQLRAFSRPALHAWRLGFAHPRTGIRLELEAPVPDDLRQLWQGVTAESWDPRG